MEVSIKTRSTPASLSFKGQAIKQAPVKWSIDSVYPLDGTIPNSGQSCSKVGWCYPLFEQLGPSGIIL